MATNELAALKASFVEPKIP